MVEEIVANLNDEGFFTKCYTHDLAIIVSDRYAGTTLQLMQTNLTLSIRDVPVKECLLRRKSKLEFKKHIKCIGVVVDSKRNCRKYSESKIEKILGIFRDCQHTFEKPVV